MEGGALEIKIKIKVRTIQRRRGGSRRELKLYGAVTARHLRYAEPGRELAEFVPASARGRDSEHRLPDHRMMPRLLRGDLPRPLQGAQAARMVACQHVAACKVDVVVPAPY